MEAAAAHLAVEAGGAGVGRARLHLAAPTKHPPVRPVHAHRRLSFSDRLSTGPDYCCCHSDRLSRRVVHSAACCVPRNTPKPSPRREALRRVRGQAKLWPPGLRWPPLLPPVAVSLIDRRRHEAQKLGGVRLPCFGAVLRAVTHVALGLGHTHPAVGARLGHTRVVGQLAAGTVEEPPAPAAQPCGAQEARPRVRHAAGPAPPSTR